MHAPAPVWSDDLQLVVIHRRGAAAADDVDEVALRAGDCEAAGGAVVEAELVLHPLEQHQEGRVPQVRRRDHEPLPPLPDVHREVPPRHVRRGRRPAPRHVQPRRELLHETDQRW